MLNQLEKDLLIRLEGRRHILILEREDTWRLNSRAIWLACGDDNTNFFHAYDRGRKAANTVWNWMNMEQTMTPLMEWPILGWIISGICLKPLLRNL